MDINKQNYEEYFLLYIDNELSEQEKMQVNLFVSQHPQLQAELESLQAVTLPTANNGILMPNKQLLYKTADHLVNEHNYENYFLLYIDNALLQTEKLAVDQFVANNPIYRPAFEALLATKLPIENIPFTNKHSLYKNTTKVIPLFHWQKWAAAAVIVGFISTLWIVDWKNVEKPMNSTVKQVDKLPNNSKQIDFGTKEKQHKSDIINPDLAQKSTIETAKTIVVQNSVAKIINKEKTLTTSKPKQAAPSDFNSHQATIATNTIRVHDHAPVNNATLANKTNEQATTENSSIANNTVLVANTIIASNSTTESNTYRELNTETDNKSLYIGALEINKDKLRGVTRRIASFFGKKIKKEEENIKEAFAVN